MQNIFIIDDDHTMAECIARAVRAKTPQVKLQIFANAIEATAALNEVTPDLIFLDVLLDGPDAFTFLHELVSYTETEKVPVVIVSSLDFTGRDLSNYGVVGILQKDTMTPQDIQRFL